MAEKWCDEYGWGETERSEWIKNAIKDRSMEQNFWEGAQERGVRDKGPVITDEELEAEDDEDQTGENKDGRRSALRRLFASVGE